jgi:hypothetical protein
VKKVNGLMLEVEKEGAQPSDTEAHR